MGMGKCKGRKGRGKKMSKRGGSVGNSRAGKSTIATFFKAQLQNVTTKDDLYKLQDIIEDKLYALEEREEDEEDTKQRVIYTSLFTILKEKVVELKKAMKNKRLLVIFEDDHTKDIIDRIDITDNKRTKTISIDSTYGEAGEFFDGIDGEGFNDNKKRGEKEIEQYLKKFKIYSIY